MALFDYKTFLELTGKGGGPATAIGTAFGMPSCLLNLTDEVLGLLPTSILNSIRGSTANGANRADDVVKAGFAKLRFLHGIIEYDTEDGTFRFVSDSSKSGLDRNEGGLLGDLGGFVGALGAAAGFAGRLYNNYNTTVAQIEGIKDCLSLYNDYLSYTGANAADKRMQLAGTSPEKYQEIVTSQFGIDSQDLRSALQFKLDALSLMQRLDSVIALRLANPELEPQITEDFSEFTSGTNLNVASIVELPQAEEIFRLSFGPPLSRQGKFILSVDGLYFDSQTSGIVPALLELEDRKSQIPENTYWRLDLDPNLGGRGKEITLNDLKTYVKTITDFNILDDSNYLQPYYEQDNLLLDLIGQKNRRVYDVSSQVGQLINEAASEILIANMRQVMLSEASHFLTKINKRKKQIELAVKIPVLYGKGSLYAPGEIPINDFSYLEGINFDVDVNKQRHLVLNQADVSSVVLPLSVKYTQQIDTPDTIVLEHLLLTNISKGSIVSDSSGISTNKLNINRSIVTDGLIAFYNYLTAENVDASSTEYKLHNSSDKGKLLDAQLVSNTPEEVFNKGLGIVYLHGVTKNSTDSPTVPSSLGSFIKLPPARELQDLLYNPKGATIDTWVHVPELDGELYGFGQDHNVSGLYRLILANENTGLQSNSNKQSNILRLVKDDGLNTVNGLVFGFTRDRRLTRGLNPNNSSENNEIEYTSLFLAPTQSYDISSVGFIAKPLNDTVNCYENNGWYCMTHSIWDTTNGVSLSACGREFSHIAVTFSPYDNEIKMYCDGQLLSTSSYSNVFGIDPRNRGINIPSLKKNNSFEYNTTSMASVDVEQLQTGPKLDNYFTPWILGGGYTDGMQTGNFMGGEYGGIISGLKGYLGGTKFYSRVLTPDEILNNYTVNRDFFKNIDVPNLMWEPIISIP